MGEGAELASYSTATIGGDILSVYVSIWIGHRTARIIAIGLFGYNMSHMVNMGTHMKTTIEVSDALFAAAKQRAKRNRTTMRSLFEEGLRRVLSDAPPSAQKAFVLRDASVRGKSAPMLSPSEWANLETQHVIGRVAKPKA